MDNKISLCMIVRNEAANIRRCLNSLQGVVDEIIIVDTGSSDSTPQIAKEFGAKVFYFTWKQDFSQARNVSLDQATGEWILFLDADEEIILENRDTLRRITTDPTIDGYFLKIINHVGTDGWVETCEDLVFRLFRNQPNYRFRGAIHEQIVTSILEQKPQAHLQIAADIEIVHYGYLNTQIEDKDKKNRNLAILCKELAYKPDDPLLRYHYGVELFRSEKYEDAARELVQSANWTDPQTIYFPKLFRYIVMSYQLAGQHEAALEAAQLGLKFFPNYADLYYYTGLIRMALRQYSLARTAFQTAISMPLQPPQYASFAGVRGFRSYYHLGEIAETFLNHELALENFMAALQDNQAFTPALESIIQILKPWEDPVYALQCLDKAFDLCTPQALQMVAEICYRLGAYKLVLNYIERLAKALSETNNLNNSSLETEWSLRKAICLIQERRYFEALRILESYTPDDALYPLARFNQLFCYWLQDENQKVPRCFDDLGNIRLDEDTTAFLTLFLTHPPEGLSRNMDETFLAQTRSGLIFLHLDGLNSLLETIQRLLAMGELQKASHLLAQVDSECLNSQKLTLAKFYLKYGYYTEAKVLLTDHLRATSNAETYFLLGEIALSAGDYPEADQYFRLALQMNPDDPCCYIKLINLYEERRLHALEDAKHKYPDNEIFLGLAGEAII